MSEFKSLKEQVYNYISEKINAGVIKTHEKINEKMIMEDLNISRTPVREALIQLFSEGYLENEPRKGFTVKEVDDQKVIEIYGILGVLDGYAASLAMDYLTSSDYRDMDMLIYGMEKAIEDRDFKGYYELQMRFHIIYIEKSENAELSRIMAMLKKIFIRQSYSKFDENNFQSILSETNAGHKMILQLLKEGKKKELEAYIRNTHWHSRHALYDSFDQ